MTTVLPDKYPDPEYEKAHRDTFAAPTANKITPVLPPGVRKDDFAAAIKEFASVVGEAAVFVDEALSDYIDPYDIWEADKGKRKVPSAAVWCGDPPSFRYEPTLVLICSLPSPGSIDELRGVLEIANKYAIPMWTFSRGKNLG